ncbi:MAG: PQQ-dependent sugar dehydrogenase, partial [Verrucomicrobiota bacterium]
MLVKHEFSADVIPDRDDATPDDLSPFLKIERDQRLYSVEFHPDYPATPEVFICIKCKNWPDFGAGNRIFRYQVKTENGRPFADTNTRELVIEWHTDGHDGCDMRFGPDGMLYFCSGDGQKPADPANTGQHTDDLLGSIIRIDVSEAPYTVPADNPFVGIDGVRPEVWAYGYRNPWRMHFDEHGHLWVGDNGEDLWEMLHRVQAGDNAGWSAFEGGRPYRPHNLGGPVKTIAPAAITHSHTEAQSIIGGRQYRGSRYPELSGRIVYGDFVTGKLWSFLTDKDGTVHDLQRWADVPSFPSFGEDSDGELFVVGTKGMVYRIVKHQTSGETLPFPEKLSDTGLFEDTATHLVAAGLHRYDVAIPQWRDGAQGERYFGIPANSERPPLFRGGDGVLVYPEGGVAMITLTKNEKRIETQLIFKDKREFFFYTYAWNDEQTDARLIGGEGEAVTLADGTPWRYMSRAECSTCHTAQTGFLSGFNFRQLSGCSTNPVDKWMTDKLLLGWGNVHAPEPYPEWNGTPPKDPAQLAKVARGYLDTNCASCHREGGAAGRADFLLLSKLALEETGMVGVTPRLNISG